jgi:hypothetical protein
MNSQQIQQFCNYLINLENRVSKLESNMKRKSTINENISIKLHPQSNNIKKSMNMTRKNMLKSSKKKSRKTGRKVGRFTVYDD